jgi:hypothetical protein
MLILTQRDGFDKKNLSVKQATAADDDIKSWSVCTCSFEASDLWIKEYTVDHNSIYIII